MQLFRELCKFTHLIAKHCPVPPEPPAPLGSVKVLNSGLMYGRNCSTGGTYKPVDSSGTCSTPTHRMISTGPLNATHSRSNYKIYLHNSVPGGVAMTLFTFSQPVGLESVQITGSYAVIVNVTSSANTLIVEAGLSPTINDNFYDMRVTSETGGQEPCLIFVSCSHCQTTDNTCDEMRAHYHANATQLQNMTRYASTVEYKCGLGMEFKLSGSATQATQTMSCAWDQTWKPRDTLYPCDCKSSQLLRYN